MHELLLANPFRRYAARFFPVSGDGLSSRRLLNPSPLKEPGEGPQALRSQGEGFASSIRKDGDPDYTLVVFSLTHFLPQCLCVHCDEILFAIIV